MAEVSLAVWAVGAALALWFVIRDITPHTVIAWPRTVFMCAVWPIVVIAALIMFVSAPRLDGDE